MRLLVRQLAEPGWVCVRVDDPEPCDRCPRFSYVVWKVFERPDKRFRPFVGNRLCPDCIKGSDLEPEEAILRP
jgi:hypothetical protein